LALNRNAKTEFNNVPNIGIKNVFIARPPPQKLCARAMNEKVIERGVSNINGPIWNFCTRSENKWLMMARRVGGTELKQGRTTHVMPMKELTGDAGVAPEFFHGTHNRRPQIVPSGFIKN
jgi:hypothetical protein